MRILKKVKRAKNVLLKERNYSTESPKNKFEKVSEIYESNESIWDKVIHTFENIYIIPHDYLGLSWGLSIIVGTFIIRTIIFPISLKNVKNSAKYKDIAPQIQEINKEMMSNPKEAEKFRKLKKDLETKSGSSMSKIFLYGALPVPFTLLGFFSLRELTSLPELKDQGLLWFQDLTIYDPYYILPLLTAFFNLAAFEIPVYFQNTTPSKMESYVRWGFRGLIFIFLPITSQFPSGLLLSWTTSSFLSIIQNFCFHHPKSRQFLKIPLHPSQLKDYNLKIDQKIEPIKLLTKQEIQKKNKN